MANIFKLTRDVRSNWRRQNLGKRAVDDDIKPATFTLGKDFKEACNRVVTLEKCWEAVERDWQKDRSTAVPLWTADTYAIALAVARGESPIMLDIPQDDRDTAANYPDPENVYAVWIGTMRQLFPFLDIRINDPQADKIEQAGADLAAQLDRQAAAVKETARQFKGASGSEMLHPALDAYGRHLKDIYPDSGYGRTQGNLVTLLKSQLDNAALNTLTADRLDKLLAHLSGRPASKHDGQPLAFYTCRNAFITFRQFVRWLDRSEAYRWQLPRGYSFSRQRIRKLAPDMVKPRRTFTRDELRLLWTYATPWERALMALSLNCGFSKAELSTLQPAEVVSGERTYIKRARVKTDAYGEWILWPETLAALDYFKKLHKTGPYVVVSKTGRQLDRNTAGGNENQTIRNHWARLLKRVRADYPDLPALPYKHLRKTAASLIRKLAKDGRATELASLFLAHTEGADSADQLLPAYTDRPWRKLHKVILRLRRYLLPVLTAVPDPWEGKRFNISPLQLQRIRAMRAEGKTLQEIATATGKHWTTIAKYCR